MGKNHFQKYHATEGRIKRCLRCIINNKSEFIESQAAQIADLKYSLDKSHFKNDKMLDEIEYLKNDLRIALERKEYYKDKYYRDKE